MKDNTLKNYDINKIKPYFLKGIKSKTDNLISDIKELSDDFSLSNIIDNIYFFSDNLYFTAKNLNFDQLTKVSELIIKIYEPIIEKKIRFNKEIFDLTSELINFINGWNDFTYSSNKFNKIFEDLNNKTNKVIEFAFLCSAKDEIADKQHQFIITSNDLLKLKDSIYDIYSNFSSLINELDENLPERFNSKNWHKKYVNLKNSFKINLTGIQKEYFSFRGIDVKPMVDSLEYDIRNYAMNKNKKTDINFSFDEFKLDIFYSEILQKILFELSKNSIDHSFSDKTKEPEINIIFKKNNEDMFITFIDNGEGFEYDKIINKAKSKNLINSNDMIKIDKLFFNLIFYNLTGKTKGKGLKKIKNYLENINGKIWFNLQDKKGTKLYIQFPLYKKIV